MIINQPSQALPILNFLDGAGNQSQQGTPGGQTFSDAFIAASQGLAGLPISPAIQNSPNTINVDPEKINQATMQLISDVNSMPVSNQNHAWNNVPDQLVQSQKSNEVNLFGNGYNAMTIDNLQVQQNSVPSNQGVMSNGAPSLPYIDNESEANGSFELKTQGVFGSNNIVPQQGQEQQGLVVSQKQMQVSASDSIKENSSIDAATMSPASENILGSQIDSVSQDIFASSNLSALTDSSKVSPVASLIYGHELGSPAVSQFSGPSADPLLSTAGPNIQVQPQAVASPVPLYRGDQPVLYSDSGSMGTFGTENSVTLSRQDSDGQTKDMAQPTATQSSIMAGALWASAVNQGAYFIPEAESNSIATNNATSSEALTSNAAGAGLNVVTDDQLSSQGALNNDAVLNVSSTTEGQNLDLSNYQDVFNQVTGTQAGTGSLNNSPSEKMLSMQSSYDINKSIDDELPVVSENVLGAPQSSNTPVIPASNYVVAANTQVPAINAVLSGQFGQNIGVANAKSNIVVLNQNHEVLPETVSSLDNNGNNFVQNPQNTGNPLELKAFVGLMGSGGLSISGGNNFNGSSSLPIIAPQVKPEDLQIGLNPSVVDLASSRPGNSDMKILQNNVQKSVNDEVFSQIVEKANLMINAGVSQINIVLKPEHLGTLLLQVTHTQNALSASIQTPNAAVSDVLKSQLGALKTSLAAEGVHLQNLNVFTGSNFNQNGNNAGNWERADYPNILPVSLRSISSEDNYSLNRIGSDSLVDVFA